MNAGTHSGSAAASERAATSVARRILVADDDDDLRSLVSSALTDEGWTVIEARSGDQALALARDQTLSVIVLDSRMPGLSGPEVYRRLRAAHISTPVLLVTSFLDARDTAAELGIRDYLGKPFGLESLYEAVARVAGLERDPRHR